MTLMLASCKGTNWPRKNAHRSVVRPAAGVGIAVSCFSTGVLLVRPRTGAAPRSARRAKYMRLPCRNPSVDGGGLRSERREEGEVDVDRVQRAADEQRPRREAPAAQHGAEDEDGAQERD